MYSDKHSHNDFPLMDFLQCVTCIIRALNLTIGRSVLFNISIKFRLADREKASRFIHYIILYQHARARTYE